MRVSNGKHRVDFENRILDELRLGLHCRKKSVAGHFCTQKELAENLRMSISDVRYWLPRLVKEQKLHHERVTHNHKLKDKFTVIDPKLFTSKDIINHHKQFINNQLLQLEFLVDKMKKTPALYDVKITAKAWTATPVFKGKLPRNPKKIPKKYWLKASRPTSLTSKVNKKGYEYLETFCNGINEIFTFIDSISYSSLEHNVIDMINNLRTPSFVKIQKLVRRLVSGLTDIEKHAMYSILLPRIPIFNQLNQIEKTKNLKPF